MSSGRYGGTGHTTTSSLDTTEGSGPSNRTLWSVVHSSRLRVRNNGGRLRENPRESRVGHGEWSVLPSTSGFPVTPYSPGPTGSATTKENSAGGKESGHSRYEHDGTGYFETLKKHASRNDDYFREGVPRTESTQCIEEVGRSH